MISFFKKRLAEGVVGKVSDEENCSQWEFYLPQKAVIRKNAESAKLQIVYEASKRENRKILYGTS